MPLDPETFGRQSAEALVFGLEQLKQSLGGERAAPLESQLRAGEAAVAAMKQLLGGLGSEMPKDD